MTVRRSGAAGILALLLAALVFAGLIGLGIWQVQRLAWKTDLIARTETRLMAKPVPPPRAADFAAIEAPEYMRLALTGQYLEVPSTLVQALTVQGRGFWVMSPFISYDGQFILINRGFIPEAARDIVPAPPRGEKRLTGLLRLSQPDGAFLRSNDPAAGRWFSRDVGAIAGSLGLPQVAPWFLDLGQPGEAVAPGTLPVPGLTVVEFRNSHLGYAATWFALAGIWAFGLFMLWRPERKATL